MLSDPTPPQGPQGLAGQWGVTVAVMGAGALILAVLAFTVGPITFLAPALVLLAVVVVLLGAARGRRWGPATGPRPSTDGQSSSSHAADARVMVAITAAGLSLTGITVAAILLTRP